MATNIDPLDGSLPVDADLSVPDANDAKHDDDVVEKGDDAERDDLDDVEEVLPQGARSDDPEALP